MLLAGRVGEALVVGPEAGLGEAGGSAVMGTDSKPGMGMATAPAAPLWEAAEEGVVDSAAEGSGESEVVEVVEGVEQEEGVEVVEVVETGGRTEVGTGETRETLCPQSTLMRNWKRTWLSGEEKYDAGTKS